ncbi:hypothetical protein HMPREF0023_0066, partial [Acinetobacter sp. ATCC 27244]
HLLEKSVFKKAKAIGKKSKSNFAIKFAIDETEWLVPKYIVDGLIWLSKGENSLALDKLDNNLVQKVI